MQVDEQTFETDQELAKRLQAEFNKKVIKLSVVLIQKDARYCSFLK